MWCGRTAVTGRRHFDLVVEGDTSGLSFAPTNADGLERAADPRVIFENAGCRRHRLGDEGIGFKIAMPGSTARINMRPVHSAARQCALDKSLAI